MHALLITITTTFLQSVSVSNVQAGPFGTLDLVALAVKQHKKQMEEMYKGNRHLSVMCTYTPMRLEE